LFYIKEYGIIDGGLFQYFNGIMWLHH